MARLTKTAIDAATATASDTFVWCSELPGFGVRVQPSGRKTYVVRYRTHAGTQRKMTLARCCDMPPDKARELARKAFSSVAEGKDPARDKRDAREAPTMADLWERYRREHAVPFKKPSSVESDDRNWRLHVQPALGGKKIAEVTRSDVVALQVKLADRRVAANHVVALLGKMFNLAEEWLWRDANSNPCRRLKKFVVNERETILSPEQIGAVDQAINDLVAERSIPYAMACLVRLWLLTGCRNSEIRMAERAWVDFGRQLLLLPDSKVGQRRIPLPDAAIAIIRTLPEGRWLIPGRIAGQPLKAPYGMWKRILTKAGVPADVRPHDIRHTVGSLGHQSGLSQRAIQQQLGHKQISTTERYIHSIASEQSRAAAKIADIVTSAWARPTREAEPA